MFDPVQVQFQNAYLTFVELLISLVIFVVIILSSPVEFISLNKLVSSKVFKSLASKIDALTKSSLDKVKRAKVVKQIEKNFVCV